MNVEKINGLFYYNENEELDDVVAFVEEKDYHTKNLKQKIEEIVEDYCGEPDEDTRDDFNACVNALVMGNGGAYLDSQFYYSEIPNIMA